MRYYLYYSLIEIAISCENDHSSRHPHAYEWFHAKVRIFILLIFKLHFRNEKLKNLIGESLPSKEKKQKTLNMMAGSG